MDDFSFSRPIPGQSLTAELGARPLSLIHI